MAVKYPLAVKDNKLTIKPVEPAGEPISVQFNPTSYSVAKTVKWDAQANTSLNAPLLLFGGGGTRTLTLELFFDVTEPVDGQEFKDVRDLTDAVAALSRKIKDNAAPPVCEINWGAKTHGSDFPFTGVVTSFTQRFTHFASSGEPVRAFLTLTFSERGKPGEDLRDTDPELTTRVVKRGDTLTSIATEVYRDPTLWRVIAQANDLDDPRRPQIGQVLTVPKVGTRNGSA